MHFWGVWKPGVVKKREREREGNEVSKKKERERRRRRGEKIEKFHFREFVAGHYWSFSPYFGKGKKREKKRGEEEIGKTEQFRFHHHWASNQKEEEEEKEKIYSRPHNLFHIQDISESPKIGGEKKEGKVSLSLSLSLSLPRD